MITSSSHLKYGKALFTVASESQHEDKVLGDLESLDALSKNSEMKKLMTDICYLDSSAQEKVLQLTFHGKIHEITMNLLILLARAKKLMILPLVVDAYRKMYHTAKGVKAVTVRSARKLAPEEAQKLMKSLEDSLKTRLDVRFEEDPALIGGVQIYEGSKLTDYSVKNYLEMLRKHLLQINN